MKVTVCELRNCKGLLAEEWQQLQEHVYREQSELLLLPEMPWSAWLAEEAEVDVQRWLEAVQLHEQGLSRLSELGCAVVSTRPVLREGIPFHEGFLVEKDGRYQALHDKVYLPEEPGWWEASWYRPGQGGFALHDAECGRMGMLICTELWFSDRARDYMRAGIELLLCPRATGAGSTGKWLAAGRYASVVSGAFGLSSNFSSGEEDASQWGGCGWIIEPEEGELLGRTTRDEPFLSVDIDLEQARAAKRSYPRYVNA